MIIPDLNLLLYAHFSSFPLHVPARAWWERTLNDQVPVGLVAPVVFGFVRIATNRRVFDPPMSTPDAVEIVRGWLRRPRVHFLSPGARHVELVTGLLLESGASGNLSTDAQIAAIAIELGAEVRSNDADFGRFAGLRWSNPLR